MKGIHIEEVLLEIEAQNTHTKKKSIPNTEDQGQGLHCQGQEVGHQSIMLLTAFQQRMVMHINTDMVITMETVK